MMVETLKTELKIDKSSWKKVKFGEVVSEPKENTQNIIADGFQHIVGLEHIDSGDIHLRKSFAGDTDTTFTKVFRKGDVLFGRRRAYLKKAVLADFDGVCSGDITVFRAKKVLLLPELLPFIVNNDHFFDYAVKHSAGGLSPRVKFKDLANYEFLLPPKEEQQRLAELLWAMDEVIEKEKRNKEVYDIFFKKYLFDSVAGNLSKNITNWKSYKFGDLGESFSGLNGKSKNDFGHGKQFITYMNVFTNSRINPGMIDFVDVKDNENQNRIEYGNILFTGSSETPQDVGMSSVVLDDLGECYLNSFCFGFRLHNFEKLLPEYARFLLRGEHVRKFMFKNAQGSTRFNLSKTTVKSRLKLLLPPIEEQKVISSKLEEIEKMVVAFEQQIKTSQSLQKSLINQIF